MAPPSMPWYPSAWVHTNSDCPECGGALGYVRPGSQIVFGDNLNGGGLFLAVQSSFRPDVVTVPDIPPYLVIVRASRFPFDSLTHQ